MRRKLKNSRRDWADDDLVLLVLNMDDDKDFWLPN